MSEVSIGDIVLVHESEPYYEDGHGTRIVWRVGGPWPAIVTEVHACLGGEQPRISAVRFPPRQPHTDAQAQEYDYSVTPGIQGARGRNTWGHRK